MIRIQLQGIEKMQRLLDADRFDAAIASVAASMQSQAEGIVRTEAPKGMSLQTSTKGFARKFTSKKAGNMSGLMLGSKATATPKFPGSRGGKTKYPYPYPRLLEYAPKSKYKGWLKKAGKRVSAALRPQLRQVLAELRKGL